MKYLVVLTAVLVFSGCTVKTVEFMESMQIEGHHEKALNFLDSSYGKGTTVFQHTIEGRECMKQKMLERGYYMLQDDIDCTGK